MLVFADIQNVLNHGAVIEYLWNQRERGVDTARQLGALPVIGLNVKF